MRDHVIRASFVKSADHFGDVTPYEGDFDELADMLEEHGWTLEGKDGPALVMSSFVHGEGETERTRGKRGRFRQTHLIEETSLLGLDFDERDGDPVEIAKPLMVGLDAVLYTSHSHGRPGKDAYPRWRVILRLARPVTVEEYKLVWAWADAFLGGGSDKSCKDPTRLYFTPRKQAHDTAVPPLFLRSVGFGLDPDELPDGQSVASMIREKRAREDALAEEARARRAARQTTPSTWKIDKVERASRWLDAAEPAIQGANGSAIAMRVIGTVVRGFELSPVEAKDALGQWNARCQPPWSERELVHKINDAVKSADPQGRGIGWLLDADRRPADAPLARREAPRTGPQAASTSPVVNDPEAALTDSGNAERWVQMFGEDFRFDRTAGHWMKWDGGVWRKGADLEAAFTTKQVARSFLRGLDNVADGTLRTALTKHANNSESKARRDAMLSLAEQEPSIAVGATELDTNTWALNVRNGTIDLKTGKLRPHDRTELFTKQAPVDYDENAECPAFDAFLSSSLPDPEVRAWLLRWFGYCLTGEVREHVFPVLWGLVGRNGKGTLIETIFGVMGDLAMPVPTELIIEGKHEPHPNIKAQLLGARLAVAAEIKSRDRLAEATVKSLTGGDMQRARFLGQEFFSWVPTHKLMLQTNFRPKVSGGDPALFARMRVVPFTVSFIGREDIHLREKLARERPGILRRLVLGCLEWQAQGLGSAKAIDEATAEYRQESDSLGSFIEENVVFAENARVSASDLYRAYRIWSEARGEKPATQTQFGIDFKSSRALRTVKVGGYRFYMGAGLSANGDRGE